MDLRPRGSAELVDVGVRLLRRHHAQFAMMAAMGAVPLVLALGLVGRSGGREGAGALTVGASVLAIIAGVWCLVVDCAICLVAADAYHGRTPTVAGALGTVVSRLGAVLVARFLRGLLAVGATALTVFAYVFEIGALIPVLPFRGATEALAILGAVAGVLGLALVLSRYVPVPMALLVERTGAFESFRRAQVLTNGSAWRVACTLALVWVPTGAIALGTLAALAVLDASGWVVTAVYALFFGAAQPLTRVVAVLAYYDLRIRKEGYDIEVLAAATPLRSAPPVAGAPTAPPAAPGPSRPRASPPIPPAVAGGEPQRGLPDNRPAATFRP